MKDRNIYLKQLIAFKNTSPIKIVTGIRRCGKSVMFDLYERYLLKNGVSPESIIKINFESFDFDEIKDYRDLHNYIKPKLSTNGMKYILLDEIQLVKEWEKSINSLHLLHDTDIYITGSNASFLSSEISTLLSGRYVEIKMLPLSFMEFLDFNGYKNEGKLEDYFNQYLRYGGFPGITELKNNDEMIRSFLSGIYNTILMKDVIQKGNVRDATLLENVMRVNVKSKIPKNQNLKVHNFRKVFRFYLPVLFCL